MITAIVEERIVIDEFLGMNRFHPHYPLNYLHILTYRRDVLWSIWRGTDVYNLAIL